MHSFLFPVVHLHSHDFLLRQLESLIWLIFSLVARNILEGQPSSQVVWLGLFLMVLFTAANRSAVRNFKVSYMLCVPSSTGLTGELIAALISTPVLHGKHISLPAAVLNRGLNV